MDIHLTRPRSAVVDAGKRRAVARLPGMRRDEGFEALGVAKQGEREMPRTKKSTKRTTNQNEILDFDMPSQMVGESKTSRGEYGRKSTRPRTAARSSSVSRGRATARKGRKSSSSRSSGRGVAKKSSSSRGRATKRGSRRSR
jgi:hypothetical protein